MPSVEALLAEADWLTRLARSLVGRDDADDIVQETYVAALRSPPDPDRPARPWLRRVMVNVVRMRHRGRSRRDAREQAIFAADSPTPEQVLERARVERTLADLVLALDEPYRTTVLLRYREGLTAEAIAARDGIPAGTVRRRLKTAVDRLRDRLDERESSKTWRAAFAPFLVPRAAAPVWGLLVMKKILAVVVIVIALLFVGTKLVRHDKSSVIATSEDTPQALVNRVIAKQRELPRIVDEDLVALAGCVHLRGTISDSSGAPVPHARITTRREQHARGAGVDADDNGHYDLCSHFGTQLVEFTAIGFSGITTRITLAADATRDVTLLPEAVIAGTVVTADGAPVADAEITVDPFRKVSVMVERPVRATSDAAGAFRITGISPGRNVLSAVAPSLTSRQLEIVIGAGETRERVVVRMDPAARITGRVMEHGVPVANAGVSVRAPSTLHAGIMATTAADGTFTIDHSPKGNVGIVVDLFHVEAPTSVRVGDGETHVEVEVSSLGIVEGTVTNHGAPVADAVVGCPSSVANTLGEVTTKQDGHYRCSGWKPGPFGVMATDVHGRWGSAKGSIANGEIKTIDIELANDGMLCGTVRDKQGAAIAGLDLVANDAEQEDSGDATTAIDGAFCIGKLANKGTYTLSASLDGQAVTVDHPPVVLEHRADVPLVIDLKFSTIAGTVADHTGAPVPDVVVRANAVTTAADFAFDASSGAVTLTDHAGQFSLSHLPLGTYRILALARTGNASSTGAITAGTHGVTIILDDVGSIQGKLVGFTTAPSIVGTFMTGGRENIDFEVDGATFKATGLAPGDYTLQVDTFGHEADSKRVTVKAGETTQVSLSSRGTTSLDGTTVDWKTNAPLPDVRCSPPIATDHGNVGGVYNLVDSQAISDARGHFHMSDVSAGEAIVMCVGANLFGIRATTLTRDQLSTVSVAIVARDPANHSIGASFNAINRSIIQLLADGAAARAGLQIDDEVEAVDARSVEDLVGEPLMAVITNRPAGSVAKLRIKRGGDVRDIAVVVQN